MAKRFQNKLAVPQANNSVEKCKAEFANEFDFSQDVGTPNRLAKQAPKKK